MGLIFNEYREYKIPHLGPHACVYVQQTLTLAITFKLQALELLYVTSVYT